MKIGVIAANGKEGRLIVKEALDRGMERLCRDAARRSRDALVAPVRQDG